MAPPEKPHLLKKIDKAEKLEKGDVEPDHVERARKHIKHHVEDADRKELKKKVEESLDKVKEVVIVNALEELNKETDSPHEPLPETLESSPDEGSGKLESLSKAIDEMAKKISSVLRPFFKSLPSFMIKSLKENKRFGWYFEKILDEKDVMEKLEKAAKGKGKEMRETKDDEKYVDKLTEQYDALPTDKDGKKMTKEQFFQKKVNAAVGKAPALTEGYSLLDVVDVEIEEQKPRKDPKEKKDEEDKKRKDRAKEKVKEAPELTYVNVLADALNNVKPGSITIDPANWQNTVTSILAAFAEKDNVGYYNFGMEVATDGDLEEADGGNYWYSFSVDHDLVSDWQQRLLLNPADAVRDLLTINVEQLKQWGNTQAARNVEKIQKYLKENTPEDLPETPAAAPTPTPTPAPTTGPTPPPATPTPPPAA